MMTVSLQRIALKVNVHKHSWIHYALHSEFLCWSYRGCHVKGHSRLFKVFSCIVTTVKPLKWVNTRDCRDRVGSRFFLLKNVSLPWLSDHCAVARLLSDELDSSFWVIGKVRVACHCVSVSASQLWRECVFAIVLSCHDRLTTHVSYDRLACLQRKNCLAVLVFDCDCHWDRYWLSRLTYYCHWDAYLHHGMSLMCVLWHSTCL